MPHLMYAMKLHHTVTDTSQCTEQIQMSFWWSMYLGFPLVGDQQIVGGEVSVHHVVAVHELHGSCGLVRQLQPDGPLVVQPEPW